MEKRITIYCFAFAVIFQMIIMPVKIYALNYTISFTGTGASTSVGSVLVQNLTKGIEVTVPTGNVLNLYDFTTSVDNVSNNVDGIAVYPNPIQGKSTVSFYAKKAGKTQIYVFGIEGKNQTGVNYNLQEGNNQFQLSLNPGAYILKVNGNGYTYASRVISESNSTNKQSISFIGNQKPTNSQPQKTKSGGVTSMLYSTGDQLLYKGYSGNFSTIVTDVPTESKTTNFYFVECKDADNNFYPIVVIGNQIWMAENLRTSSYRTGESISNITDNNLWGNATFGAWCYFNNDANYNLKFGKLYNWLTVNDSRKIAPLGWHVASDGEYTTLTDYISLNLGKSPNTAKALSSNSDWTIDVGAETVGNNTSKNNSSGFSAMPGGSRNGGAGGTLDGAFGIINSYGQFWTSTDNSINLGINASLLRYFAYDSNNIIRPSGGYTVGISVRCICDITISIPPTLVTSSVTTITGFSAICGGNIILDGGSTVTSRGVCWSTSPNPTNTLTTKTSDATGVGTYTSSITGLSPNTTYYIRAFATNSIGTSYGNETSFTTATTPTISTNIALDVTNSNATVGGNITNDGGAAIISRGVCWSTNPNPTISNNKNINGSGTGMFSSSITGLFSSTTYYIRAFATNSVGTSYGNEQIFTTTKACDIDGNLYSSVTIGTQTWMGENLKTTKYRTGESISNISNSTSWNSASFGAWCDYDNLTDNGIKYGHLYNWYSVIDSRNIAPVGWHIPSDAEWTTLTDFLGGETVAGGKLKEIGTTNWRTPNTNGSNETNFTALPGGYRFDNGLFSNNSDYGYWWCNTQSDASFAWFRTIAAASSNVYRNKLQKTNGFSVRCIRDGIPTLTTTDAILTTYTTASTGGNISFDGGSAVISRGVCWSLNPNPTIEDSKTTDGTGSGAFTSLITNLKVGLTYYLKSYATNTYGIAYGNQITLVVPKPLIDNVSIPAGTFIMGSPVSEVNHTTAETQHEVTLSAFRMSKYEITNSLFAIFLNANSIGNDGIYSTGTYPLEPLIYASSGTNDYGLHYTNNQWIPVSGKENYPVINVTWYGASEFAAFFGGRLPTESEWEYACRANTTTPFNTGECLTYLQANYQWQYPYSTCPNNGAFLGKSKSIGTFASNAFGLYDMHGNVNEWCSDWYGTYPTTSQTNPTGPATGTSKVYRGGGFITVGTSCRSAFRTGNNPKNYTYTTGLRIVMQP